MDATDIKRKQYCVMSGDNCDNDGNYDSAINHYNRALQIDPEDADVWFNKGITLKKIGNYNESNKCIETAINLYCGR
jgi:tetratricopeptide (TPR) repeat protein